MGHGLSLGGPLPDGDVGSGVVGDNQHVGDPLLGPRQQRSTGWQQAKDSPVWLRCMLEQAGRKQPPLGAERGEDPRTGMVTAVRHLLVQEDEVSPGRAGDG